MNTLKKLVVGLVVLTMMTAALPVFANQEEELKSELEAVRAELAEFQKMVADLLGQGETPTTTPTQISGIPANFTFTTPLREGSRGTDVRYLQIVLNSDPDTRVAASGAGSPGNETEYFGPATRAAVIKFQNKYTSEVLAPIGLALGTGYVGNQTIAKLNRLLTDGEVVTPPSQPDVLKTILEKLETFSSAIQDIAKRVERLEDPSKFEDEGYFNLEVRGTIRNVEITSEDTKDVAVFRMEAKDSDIVIQRMDIYFGESFNSTTDKFVLGDITASEFRRLIDNVALYVGGERVAQREISRATIERGDTYVRFSGLDIKIAKDSFKDVTVQVTAANVSDADDTIVIGFEKNAIRGLDGAGITVYNDDVASRSFSLVGEEKGAIEARRHTNTPKEGIALTDIERYTEVDLLKFTLTAKDTDIELDKLDVRLYGDVDVVEDLILYEGNDEIDVVSAKGHGDKHTFDVDLVLKKGVSRTFIVVADVIDLDADNQEKVISASVLRNDNTAVGYDAFDNPVEIDRNINGYEQTLFSVYPSVTLKSKSISVSSGDARPDRLSANMTLAIKALGGDVYIKEVNLADTGPNDTSWSDLFDFSNLEKLTDDEFYTGYTGTVYRVIQDETKDIIIRGNLDVGVAANSGWYSLEIDSIVFYAEESDGGVYHEFTLDSSYEMIDKLETEEVYAYGHGSE